MFLLQTSILVTMDGLKKNSIAICITGFLLFYMATANNFRVWTENDSDAKSATGDLHSNDEQIAPYVENMSILFISSSTVDRSPVTEYAEDLSTQYKSNQNNDTFYANYDDNEFDLVRKKRFDDENNTDFNETDNFTISDEEYLNGLWNHISPKSWTWVLMIFHTIVFVVGIIGNILVCVAVYRNHTMRTVTNYFIVNLAVADFLVILFCLPPSVVWDVTLTWFFGVAMCKVVLYFQVRISCQALECTRTILKPENILELFNKRPNFFVDYKMLGILYSTYQRFI